MTMIVRSLVTFVVVLCAWVGQVAAQSFETSATAAYVLDQTTGTVLLAKNADTPLPPASMSKLMTIYMAFEAVADGRLKIDEKIAVSSHAASYGGSSMFLDTTDRVTVEDLLRGVIVLMRDLGLLANSIITDFPTYYPLFSERVFAFDGRVPANSRNRNPVLGLGIGADGLKTGHTQEAGYGLVGSAKQGDRRVIFVLTGMDSAEARAEESEKIVNWAFRQFAQRDVVRSGIRIAEADVWMGETSKVGITVKDDLSLLVPVLSQDNVNAEAIFDSPLEAPVLAGQTVGELIITLDGLPEARVDLVTQSAVAVGGFETRMRMAAQVLMRRFGLNAAETPA